MSIERELIITPRSPFARRVRVACLRLGLSFKETAVDAFNPPDWLFKTNPLGLIPFMKVTQTSTSGEKTTEVWVDSQTILENLHDETGRVWPTQAKHRRQERKVSALAQGLMQLSVQIFLERKKASPDAETIEEYLTNVRNTLKTLELEVAPLVSREIESVAATLTQPICDLVIAYDYLKLRNPEIALEKEAPELTRLAEAVSLHEWFQKTHPPA